MMTSTILTTTIFILLMLCNTCVIASESECPPTHKQKSSDVEAMKKRFDGWVKQHGRKYKHNDEREVRFGIYQANVQYIQCKNAQKNSYNLTDNKFADLTNEEFQSTYMGLSTRLRSHNTGFRYDEHGDLPESKDWRKEGAVTEIMDQGQCGNVSCNRIAWLLEVLGYAISVSPYYAIQAMLLM